VTTRRTRPYFFRCALRVALCYVFALQVFAATINTALAVSRGSGPGFDFIICHGGGTDKPSGNTGTSRNIQCVLCTITASSVLPPDPLSILIRQTAVASGVLPIDIPVVVRTSAVRAGQARAPPHFRVNS
jgi:hypothetical protein